jgi:hypothetical protein
MVNKKMHMPSSLDSINGKTHEEIDLTGPLIRA